MFVSIYVLSILDIFLFGFFLIYAFWCDVRYVCILQITK